MQILVTALALSKAMAMLSQPALRSDKPRIVHGPLYSVVLSYPSQGGLVRKGAATRVELDWLGLMSPTSSDDGNQTQAIHNANEEDDFALRMMQLGGRWWPSEELFERHCNADYPYGHHYPPHLDVCYPHTGGVLVLRTWAGNSPYLSDLPGVAPWKPDTWSRLSLCATMEERCDVLRAFGGSMYDSLRECPDVPESLEEGIAQWREYERLLKMMEDDRYVDQWFNTLKKHTYGLSIYRYTSRAIPPYSSITHPSQP